MPARDGERTVSQLFEFFSQLAKLVQNELDLARAELSEKLTAFGASAGFIGAGSILLVPSLVLILLAIASWLVILGLAPPVAYFITGLGTAVVALGLVWVGVRRLSGDALKPTATITEMQRDKRLAQELMR